MAVSAAVVPTLLLTQTAGVAMTGPAHRLSAGTVVTVGQVATTGNSTTAAFCNNNATLVQTGLSGGTSYATPTAGVITELTHPATAFSGRLRAVFFTNSGGTYQVVAKSRVFSVSTGTTNRISVRIPVPAGAVMGMFTLDPISCLFIGDVGDTLGLSGAFNPDVDTTFTPTSTVTGYRVNLAASLESDADRDGFGDVSQDHCLGISGPVDGCPDTTAPNTRITKHPKKRTTKRRARFVFTSTEVRSTFRCKVDRRPFKACSSSLTAPLRVWVKPGRHQFKVRARDLAGNLDLTPAVFRWRVRR